MQRSILGIDISRISRLRRAQRVQNTVTLGLVLLGPVLAGLTFIVLGPLDQGNNSPSLRLVLLADLVYVMVVAALVLRQVAQMIADRRAHSAGSKLHLRLTGVFALLALIPAVLVAIFAVVTVNFGLEGWFSERVRNVVGTSLSAAEAYESEHRDDLTRDAAALAAFLDTERQATFFMSDGEVRQALGRVQSQIERGLTEAFVIDGLGDIRARGARSYEFGFERPSPEQITQADSEGLVIIEDWANDEFRALMPLGAFEDRYLYVSRAVDGEILSLLDDTRQTVALYEQLEADRGRLLFEFALLYLGFALILILAAVWLGLWFAGRLSAPIGRLVTASQRVGEGDLEVRVIEEEGDDEISQLGKYFNQMTTRLKAQRDELLDNTDQIESRRRLFDSVLSSVTSGVVGLDPEGRVTFVNRSAQRLLDMGKRQRTMALATAVPEFAPLFASLVREKRAVTQDQVSLIRAGQQETLLVRMAQRLSESGDLEGYVVAFDDISSLVTAQRMAAWGDVARRIAHEIKNPLTPIQLSAERIKRKFSPVLGGESADLAQLTDVIIRQTNDLRRIVDEFSKFARMPEPVRTSCDLNAVVRDAVTLQQAGQPDVTFTAELQDRPVMAEIDATLISQALTNLLKNAGEAIETLNEKAPIAGHRPEIQVSFTLEGNSATIGIADNGIGLPEDRARLFEPYVTTREKGTGLGLSIVNKIIEDHGGTLRLLDAPLFGGTDRPGALARITLPVATAATENRNKIDEGAG